MSEYNAYPLSWPLGWQRHNLYIDSRFGKYRRPSVALGSSTVLDQLRMMGVPDWQVVISTNVTLRLDGWPYSNQKEPQDPGAAVYWTAKNKAKRVLACDKYRTVGENLYAIGKTIEATRAIERYGSVTTEQAFAGYVALEEKTQASCWEVLGIGPVVGGNGSENTILDAYRRKARETHPDNGGSAESFSEVVRAKEMALQLVKQ